MLMAPGPRKFALTAHVACSVGSLGGVAAFLALAVAGVTTPDAWMARAAYSAMGVIAWFVVLPLVLGSLLSGLVQALGTPWGLFRHWWVLAKLLLTGVVTIILVLQLEAISQVAVAAADAALSGDLG